MCLCGSLSIHLFCLLIVAFKHNEPLCTCCLIIRETLLPRKFTIPETTRAHLNGLSTKILFIQTLTIENRTVLRTSGNSHSVGEIWKSIVPANSQVNEVHWMTSTSSTIQQRNAWKDGNTSLMTRWWCWWGAWQRQYCCAF